MSTSQTGPRRLKPLVALAVAFFAASCLLAVALIAWRLTASHAVPSTAGGEATRADDASRAPAGAVDRSGARRSLAVLPSTAVAPEPQAAPAPFGRIAPPPPQPRAAGPGDDDPRGPGAVVEDRARSSGARVPPGVIGTLHTRD